MLHSNDTATHITCTSKVCEIINNFSNYPSHIKYECVLKYTKFIF